jgi:4-hydroxy-L-threonine phosphate dehydrogenase PdxA
VQLESRDRGLPTIAVTMGDPGGIGPELVARLLTSARTHERCRGFAVGDPVVIDDAIGLIGARASVAPIESVVEAAFRPERVDVLVPPGGAVAAVHHGRVDAAAGRASAACLLAAATLSGVDGVVSAPLNKQALRLAGVDHTDELELLGAATATDAPMLVGVLERLWTTCVTLHVPFRAVPDLLTPARVLATIRALATALAKSRRRPRLLVAALNPHAGEGGLLGSEEIENIAPAVEQARREGLDVEGPLAADTIFRVAADRGADGVVCMYHDQANIARKLTGFGGQATVFLGLPVPVATTAHGTAFDRAGLGTADPGSITAALDAVIALAADPGLDDDAHG